MMKKLAILQPAAAAMKALMLPAGDLLLALERRYD
jgi:hypothetical protein